MATGAGGAAMQLHSHLHFGSSADTTGTRRATKATRDYTEGVMVANRESLNFLGTGLGMLFAMMGVARAVQSTTMALKEFGIVNEGNEKAMRRFNVVFQAMSSWFTLIITLQMLYLALVDRTTNAKIRQLMIDKQLTRQEAMKQVVRGGIGAPAVAIAIMVGLALVMAVIAAATAQFGYSGVINRDTIFMAHAGEEVNIGQPGSSPSGGGQTNNYYYYGDNFDEMVNRASTRNAVVKGARGV